jgi:hypothetical protein
MKNMYCNIIKFKIVYFDKNIFILFKLTYNIVTMFKSNKNHITLIIEAKYVLIILTSTGY